MLIAMSSRLCKPGLLVLALLIVVTCAGRVPAGDSYERPCTGGDLPGLWKVVRWSSSLDRDDLNSYAAPYQWYLFGRDGTLRSVTSNRPSDDVATIRTTLESLPVTVHYTCSSSGEVRTTRKGEPGAGETWQADYVMYDTVDSSGTIHFHAGDIVMSLLGRDGQVIYKRQMRQLGGKPPRQLGPR